MSKRALLIPDLQVGPERALDHLTWAARFIADKQFDIIVQIGDWIDFTSISSYDKGKAAAENRRVSKDWDAFRRSVDLLHFGWKGVGSYKPRLVYTAGNHCHRGRRYAADNPAIDCLPDPVEYLTAAGWEAYPFLEVVKVEGVHFSHLFPRSLGGRISASGLKYGAPSPEHQIRANMASCVAGHRPGYAHGTFSTAEKTYHAVIAGSYYLHREEWMGPGQDNSFKGLVVLNQLKRGEFDPCPVRMSYLKEKYGGRR